MNVYRDLFQALWVAGMLVSLSCKRAKEAPPAPHISNEPFTTVSLFMTNTQAPYDTDTATWEQLKDSTGKLLPVDTSKAHIVLKANTTYNAQIQILDKSQNPVFNVTNEIRNRANYHLFFYQPLPTTKAFVIPYNKGDSLPLPIPVITSTTAPVTSDPLNLTVTITDYDYNLLGYQLGLKSNFKTGDTSKGWLRVVLKHQPSGKNGTYAPGSIDFDVGYTVEIH